MKIYRPGLGITLFFVFLFFQQIGYGSVFKDARSLNPDLERGEKIYQACTGCHQATGWGLPSGMIPQIAGQHPRVIVRQLEHFRKGYRISQPMNDVANLEVLREAQSMADVAGYIGRLPMIPIPGQGGETTWLEARRFSAPLAVAAVMG